MVSHVGFLAAPPSAKRSGWAGKRDSWLNSINQLQATDRTVYGCALRAAWRCCLNSCVMATCWFNCTAVCHLLGFSLKLCRSGFLNRPLLNVCVMNFKWIWFHFEFLLFWARHNHPVSFPSLIRAIGCETQQARPHIPRLVACWSMHQCVKLWYNLAYINGDLTSHITQDERKITASCDFYFETGREGRSSVNNASAVFVRLDSAPNLPRAARDTQVDLARVSFSAFLLEGHGSGIMGLFFFAKNKILPCTFFFSFNSGLQRKNTESDVQI